MLFRHGDLVAIKYNHDRNEVVVAFIKVKGLQRGALRISTIIITG